MGGQFDGAGVFADGANDEIGSASRDLGLDFEGDGELGEGEEGEVLDEFPAILPTRWGFSSPVPEEALGLEGPGWFLFNDRAGAFALAGLAWLCR